MITDETIETFLLDQGRHFWFTFSYGDLLNARAEASR